MMDKGQNDSRVVFSVVMPVYNCERYLPESLESVLGQTFPDFELIAVDDGSSDGSAAVCDGFALRDSRVRVLRQPNGGPGAAMNTGIADSSGDWIVVMHADDVMLPDRLEVLARAVADGHKGVAVLTSAVELIGQDGGKLGRAVAELPSNPFFLRGDDLDYVVGGLYHPAVALRRDAVDRVGGYSAACRVNEDVEMFNRMVEAGYGIRILPEVLMKYRIHGGAASGARDRSLLLHWRFLKAQIRARRSGGEVPDWDGFLRQRRGLSWFSRFNEWRKDRAKMEYRRAASALSGGRKAAFVLCAFRSLLLQPTFILSRWRSRRK